MSDLNPKDSAGRAKVPMHLWPASATAYGSIGLLEGMLKYGRLNWRATEVSASVYVAALLRHIGAWMEGEEFSAEGAPHLGNALACLAIIVDALVNGTLVDDRNLVRDTDAFKTMMAELEGSVRVLQKNFADRNPKHWDRRDTINRPMQAQAAQDQQAPRPEKGVESVGAIRGTGTEPFKTAECDCPACSFKRALEKAVANPGEVVVLPLPEGVDLSEILGEFTPLNKTVKPIH